VLRLRARISGPIQEAIEAERRAELALFDRIDAENQAALARVYARLAAERVAATDDGR